MKQGWAIVNEFQGILQNVYVFTDYNQAKERWFEQITQYFNENDNKFQYLSEDAQKAFNDKNIDKFYDAVEEELTERKETFQIMSCKIFD